MKGGIVLVVVLCMLLAYLYFSAKTPEHFDFGRQSAPYKVVIIAGTHGNEPAGTEALNQLIDSGYFSNFGEKNRDRILLRIVPRVNDIGLRMGIRRQLNLFHPDINRNYIINDYNGQEDGKESVSKYIVNLTKDANLVIDLHEGWGYHQLSPQSIGSTLSYTGELAGKLARNAVNSLNTTIDIPEYKFVVLNPKTHPSCDIPTTLRCIREQKQKDYILIETTGQNDIQPLSLRSQQHWHLIRAILNSL